MTRSLLPAAILAALMGCAGPAPPAVERGASRQAEEEARRPPEVAVAPAPRAAAPTFRGHTGAIDLAAFSADYSRLATVSNSKEDRTVRVWDAQTGRELARFTSPSASAYGDVGDVWFLADGRKVVTEHGRSTMRLWDAQTGKLIREMGEPDDEVKRPAVGTPRPAHRTAGGTPFVAHSGDGKRKMVSGNGSGARVYAVGSDKPIMGAIGKRILPAQSLGIADFDYVYPGPDKIWSNPHGLALSEDGKRALLWVNRYVQKEPLPKRKPAPGEPMTRPGLPIIETQTVDDTLVLVDVEKAEEVRRAPVPKDWGSFQLHFFRANKPFVLVSDKEGTRLKLVSLFP